MWLSACVDVGSGQRVDAIIPRRSNARYLLGRQLSKSRFGGSDNSILDQSPIDGLLASDRKFKHDQNFAILEVRNVGFDLDQALSVFGHAAKIKQ
jgi:hypothetical protein